MMLMWASMTAVIACGGELLPCLSLVRASAMVGFGAKRITWFMGFGGERGDGGGWVSQDIAGSGVERGSDGITPCA